MSEKKSKNSAMIKEETLYIESDTEFGEIEKLDSEPESAPQNSSKQRQKRRSTKKCKELYPQLKRDESGRYSCTTCKIVLAGTLTHAVRHLNSNYHSTMIGQAPVSDEMKSDPPKSRGPRGKAKWLAEYPFIHEQEGKFWCSICSHPVAGNGTHVKRHVTTSFHQKRAKNYSLVMVGEDDAGRQVYLASIKHEMRKSKAERREDRRKAYFNRFLTRYPWLALWDGKFACVACNHRIAGNATHIERHKQSQVHKIKLAEMPEMAKEDPAFEADAPMESADMTFNKSWLEKFPFLENHDEKPFCKWCGVTIVGGLGKIKKHESSNFHLLNSNESEGRVEIVKPVKAEPEEIFLNEETLDADEGELQMQPMLKKEHPGPSRPFQAAWIKEFPFLQNRDGKAWCNWCECIIVGGRNHMLRHTNTRLHRYNQEQFNKHVILETCRICLGKFNSSQMYNPENVAREIYNHTRIILSQASDYPTKMCGTCHDDMKAFERFHRNCELAELTLANKDLNVKDVLLKLDPSPDPTPNPDPLLENQPEPQKATRRNRPLIVPRTYLCDLCGVNCRSSTTLRMHMVHRHKAATKHRCVQCDKHFFLRSGLERHLRTHSGERPFTCRFPACSRRFNDRTCLKRHEASHSGARNHKCSVCAKTFAQRYVLQIHLKTHTGERNFACTEEGCSRRFITRDKLKKHALTHVIQPLPSPPLVKVEDDPMSMMAIVEVTPRPDSIAGDFPEFIVPEEVAYQIQFIAK